MIQINQVGWCTTDRKPSATQETMLGMEVDQAVAKQSRWESFQGRGGGREVGLKIVMPGERGA